MIVCLASYPKSGNTWLRALLSTYFYSHNGEYDEKLKKFEEKRKNNGHESMTRYANEQHSAITEIMYNDMASGKRIIINDSDKQKLIQAWKELHY